MPQRFSAAATRRASARSAVTSAAVRAGVSSASRIAKAITSASSPTVAQSIRARPLQAAGSIPGPRRQAAVVSAGRSASLSSRALGAAAQPPVTGPGLDSIAVDADPLQQPLHAPLRMGGADGIPALIVQQPVQPGQHDHTLRQSRHHGDDFGQGGIGGDEAGGDHRVGRRIGSPGGGARSHRLHSAAGRIDRTLRLQNGRPVLGDDAQELDRLLPMAGEGLGRQFRQFGEIDPLGLGFVDQVGQRLGQAQRLVRRDRELVTPRHYQPGQDQVPLQGIDGRRDVARGQHILVAVQIG